MIPRRTNSKPSRSGLREIQEEIGGLSEKMAEMQSQLTHISQLTGEEYNVTQQRIRDLESHNERLSEENRRLQSRNEELADSLAHRKVEIRTGLNARDGAFRKLKHARRFIQDLLEERLELPAERDLNHDDIHAVLADALLRGSEDTSSSSNRTAQPRRVSRRTDEPQSPRDIIGSQRSQLANLPASKRSPQSQAGPSTDAGTSELNDWRIHQAKPPRTVQRSIGFLLPEGEELLGTLEKLGISKEEASTIVETLQTFPDDTDPGMRLRIDGNMAFVYDPIFLESGAGSYLIEWGEVRSNRAIEEFLLKEPAAPYFHMFVYPLKKQRWHYIGAHRWEVIKLWPLWPTLDDKTRQFVVGVIQRRTGLEVPMIEECLSSGTYEQLCIKISSDHDLVEKSGELCGQYRSDDGNGNLTLKWALESQALEERKLVVLFLPLLSVHIAGTVFDRQCPRTARRMTVSASPPFLAISSPFFLAIFALCAIVASAGPLTHNSPHLIIRQQSLSDSVSISVSISATANVVELLPTPTSLSSALASSSLETPPGFDESSTVIPSSVSTSTPTSSVPTSESVSQTSVSSVSTSSSFTPPAALQPSDSSDPAPTPSVPSTSPPPPPTPSSDTSSSLISESSSSSFELSEPSDVLPAPSISDSVPTTPDDGFFAPTAAATQDIFPAEPSVTRSAPGVTLVMTNGITDDGLPSVIRTFDYTPTPSTASEQDVPSNSGFLGNTAVVTATFTIIALVVVGAFVAGLILYRRRQRSKKFAEDGFDFYEKPTQSDSVHHTQPPTGNGREHYYTVAPYDPTSTAGGFGSISDHGHSTEGGFGGSSEYYGAQIPQDPFNADTGPIITTMTSAQAASKHPAERTGPTARTSYDSFYSSYNAQGPARS
ncbi:hypothetical protein AX16_001052 [Volvariella volvacea WC 439]|nr:hypothetical protein AX16_001052 [Volvariella volvacea WC 439]